MNLVGTRFAAVSRMLLSAATVEPRSVMIAEPSAAAIRSAIFAMTITWRTPAGNLPNGIAQPWMT